MKSLNILLVEENQLDANALKKELLSIGHKIIGVANNSLEAQNLFIQEKPDLVILDIVLKESEKNGIDLATFFNSIKKVPIIFLGNLNDNKKLRAKAIEINPANYLEKPWHPKQIIGAIDFAQHNFRKENSIQNSSLLNNGNDNITKCFYLKNNNRYERIETKKIVVVKAANTCIEIITEDNRYIFYTKLGNFIKQINHPDLIRIHRSYAINLQYVSAFNGGTAFINTGKIQKEIPIGNSYKNAFNQFFHKLKSE